MMDIALILESKFKGSQWALNGNDYSSLEWLDSTDKPTEEELENLWPLVNYETAVKAIEVLRSEAYRNISDPIFFRYQRGEATQEEWVSSVNSIREKFPYPVFEQ